MLDIAYFLHYEFTSNECQVFKSMLHAAEFDCCCASSSTVTHFSLVLCNMFHLQCCSNLNQGAIVSVYRLGAADAFCIRLRETVRFSAIISLSLFVNIATKLQGGSNMSGTNCDLFTHKSSRSYLNYLVFDRF